MKNYMINLLNTFNRKDNFVKKGKEYLNRFKPFSERNINENILVEGLYNVEFRNLNDRRFLGAMETVLILEGVINPDEKFDYQIKEEKVFGFNVKEKESYKELIIRHTKKYLIEKNVLK